MTEGGEAEVTPPGRTTRLSENDVRVVSSLLGSTLGSGEDRMRDSGLARSSYRISKRRLYEAGVVEDRYLPRPGLVGTRWVTFLLSRPFADRVGEVAGSLLSNPRSVVVLSGTHMVFSTLYHSSASEREEFEQEVHDGKLGTPIALLHVDGQEPDVPVYFDFEGAWSRFRGGTGTQGYPRALPRASGDRPRRRGIFGGGLGALSSLLKRPFEAEEGGRPQHLTGPDSLTRSQRRLLEEAQVEWRVLLSLTNPPRHKGGELADVLFTKGRLRPGVTASSMLNALVSEADLHPFLLAGDGTTALMGTLAGKAPQTAESSSSDPRPSVLPVVTRYLQDLEVLREPIGTLQAPLWHRYDRLL